MSTLPRTKTMKVLITGADGFIGKNLQLHLAEKNNVKLVCFTRNDGVAQLPNLLHSVDFVFHLAGVNRPGDPKEFTTGNVDLTQALCRAACGLADNLGKKVPIVFTSSTQVGLNNPYAQSKLAAELELQAVALSHGIPVYIFRLPNVFGKWCKPNYNSVVATFCHNITRGLPIEVNDHTVSITLAYVEDVIERFVKLMDGEYALVGPDGFASVAPQYTITLGELARQIHAFKDSRTTLMTERVGTGLIRSLYATYLSYLPVESFEYNLPRYTDSRGVFTEVIKTPDSGQFSYFTARPGVTRGGHYHHSKTEKFLVIKGQARFRFRHMQTGQTHEFFTTGDKSAIVETVPGWAHDITNIGDEELIVLLWANEVFKREKPDTFASAV
jgi:UDP-2-acetamido-2,6-beta-L-arabino-hexul-4-ose reductase